MKMRSKNLPRILSAVLALLMLLPCLSGCAESGKSTELSETSGLPEQGETEPVSSLRDENATAYNASFVESDLTAPVSRTVSTAPVRDWEAAAPTVFAPEPEKKTMTVREGDLYVSPNGDDENGDGSFEKPFASIARAQKAVQKMNSEEYLSSLPEGKGIDVCLLAGRYEVADTLVFLYKDSGIEGHPVTYRAYGDGKVVLTRGKKIDAADFHPLSDPPDFGDEYVGEEFEKLSGRFPESARDKILVLDLYQYGVTNSALKLCSFGHGNYLRYAYGGVSGELYLGEKNMTLARYPNGEKMTSCGRANGAEAGNYTLDGETKQRAIENHWSNARDAWVLGMFVNDYTDTTMPATFNEDGTVFCKHASDDMGGGLCYFYNIPEELDVPGEWYLDRTNALLYLYPPEDENGNVAPMDDIEFTDRNGDMFELFDASYLNFEGLTVRGLRDGDCFSIEECESVGIIDCVLCDCGGNGINGYGYGLLVSGCEIKYTGRAPIVFDSGEKATLTYGRTLITNNDLHDYSLLERSFGGSSFTMYGCAITHNEIHDSTAPALGCAGCNNVIEYNVIHDVVKYASDCGAWYTGSSWTSGGNELRYNVFFNIGSDYCTPCAIYWDDGMALQRAYGNLIINVRGFGFHLGGGFGLSICNNVMINIGQTTVNYDGRGVRSMKHGESFYAVGGFLWNLLQSTPYKTPIWKENFPMLAEIPDDAEADLNNPHFPLLCSLSMFKNNLVIGDVADESGVICGPGFGAQNTLAQRYSTSENNITIEDIGDVGFVDPENGDYRLREDSIVYQLNPEFADIPYGLIGRK